MGKKKLLCMILALVIIISFLPKPSVNAAETEDFITYEDFFASSEEEKTYQIPLDFTETDEAAICLVNTGKSNIDMNIYDEDGSRVSYVVTNRVLPKRWAFIQKPSEGATTVTYTVTLKVSAFCESDSNFRLMAGKKEDTEEMISGIENAVYLETYTEQKGNQMFTYYTPDNYECWYKFTAPDYAETVVTLLTYDKNIRFRIYEADKITEDGVYDSYNDPDAYRTAFCLAYAQAQKVKLKTLEVGKDYLLSIYNINPSGEKNINTKNINLTVGKPNMCGNSDTYFALSSITGTKYGYSSSATITPSGLPNTAVVDKVTLKTAFGVANMSKIAIWRVKSPSDVMWNVSDSPSMYLGYVTDATTNKTAVGKWYVSFKTTSKSASYSMLPGIEIQYYYELGD